jgi:hypothetical protein
MAQVMAPCMFMRRQGTFSLRRVFENKLTSVSRAGLRAERSEAGPAIPISIATRLLVLGW